MRFFIPVAICVAAFILGLYGVSTGLWQMFRGIESEHWPVAHGTIISSQMASYQAKTHRVYYPKISYDYQVAGSNYVSQQFAFGETSGSSAEIQLTLDYYRAGETVRVHYSPACPELAVLDTGIQGGSWVALIVGMLFVIVGSFIAHLIFRRRKVPVP